MVIERPKPSEDVNADDFIAGTCLLETPYCDISGSDALDRL